MDVKEGELYQYVLEPLCRYRKLKLNKNTLKPTNLYHISGLGTIHSMNSTRNVQFRLPQYEYLANGTYRDPLKKGRYSCKQNGLESHRGSLHALHFRGPCTLQLVIQNNKTANLLCHAWQTERTFYWKIRRFSRLKDSTLNIHAWLAMKTDKLCESFHAVQTRTVPSFVIDQQPPPHPPVQEEERSQSFWCTNQLYISKYICHRLGTYINLTQDNVSYSGTKTALDYRFSKRSSWYTWHDVM